MSEKKTRITVLVDNIPAGGLGGEWGLALLVEYGEKKILVDAGASGLFAENMEKLGFHAEDVDYAVLSHAHYDHSGGMADFFERNSRAKFHIRRGEGEGCFKKVLIFRKYIGIPKDVLSDYSDRIERVSGDYQLCEGAYLIPHKTPGLDSIGRREKMYCKTGRGLVPDDFSHEQSLVLETGAGLIIINSCSHGGAVNIIREVEQSFPGKRVYGIIGGFHLFNKSDEEVAAVARALKETGVELIVTGHCTKDRAFGIMKKELGSRLVQMHSGKVVCDDI